MKDYIDAAAFREMILCADAALSSRIQEINELNVFPVPDGDTGTNMALTLNSAAAELRKKDFASIDAAAGCVSSALLRGARGNSGVILSLLFRGISRRLKGMETVGAIELAGALADGVEQAYKAVMKPAEGTILTVSRLSAEAAVKTASAGANVESTLKSAVEAGEEALTQTRVINPVLKKAGVVDAGGKGYVVILNAMLASFRGEAAAPAESVSVSEEDSVFAQEGLDEVITFTYDTVYVIRKKCEDQDIEPLRAFLAAMGDCLVIGEDDESFKIHVHTDDPALAISESQKYGTLELAKIENMRTQAEDLHAGRKSKSTDDLEQVEKELEQSCEIAPAEKEYGIVSVCAGEGMEALFRELGTDTVVTGGQTMNPSTDDILKAVNRTPASTVFVFPNNKNIIMAAQQCAPLTEKNVIVMQSKTVPQGITALLNFSPDMSVEELKDTMEGAMSSVHTAMVTYAVRDSEFDGHPIHAGEYLAMMDGHICGSYTSITTLFREMNWAIDDLSPEFITVYYGQEVTQEDAEISADMIRGCFPDAEVSVVNGGQPVYYYMISIE